MTKKSTQLFWHFVSDRRTSFWLNISQRSFTDRYSSCRWAGRYTSSWFCFGLWSACKIKYIRFQKQNFRTASRRFPARCRPCCCLSPWPTYSSHEKFWPMSPILVFPWIQPFKSDDFSSLGKVYPRHATGSVNCKNSSVLFVMKCCLTSTIVWNPASVQSLITRFCCGSLSTRSL